jgi:hypothetical protein
MEHRKNRRDFQPPTRLINRLFRARLQWRQMAVSRWEIDKQKGRRKAGLS